MNSTTLRSRPRRLQLARALLRGGQRRVHPRARPAAAGLAGGDRNPVVRGLRVYPDGKRDVFGTAGSSFMVLPHDHCQRGVVPSPSTTGASTDNPTCAHSLCR